uniref:Uncharacterized protein n=1 Tax=Globodera rostochiensis TaxID=31243 RepID=A0A914H3M9_GLORO
MSRRESGRQDESTIAGLAGAQSTAGVHTQALGDSVRSRSRAASNGSSVVVCDTRSRWCSKHAQLLDRRRGVGCRLRKWIQFPAVAPKNLSQTPVVMVATVVGGDAISS